MENWKVGNALTSVSNIENQEESFSLMERPQKRSADFLRHSALVVWMANDDLALVRGGGDGRRRYLDFMASQMFPGYRAATRAYEKALRSRNFLLKRDASPKWDEVDAYTRILDEQGRIISAHRRDLIGQLSPRRRRSPESDQRKRGNSDIEL